MVLLFLIDIVNLMISFGISPAQAAWFKKTYNENPDLCTFSIDDAVNEELNSLLLDIQSKYKGLIYSTYSSTATLNKRINYLFK